MPVIKLCCFLVIETQRKTIQVQLTKTVFLSCSLSMLTAQQRILGNAVPGKQGKGKNKVFSLQQLRAYRAATTKTPRRGAGLSGLFSELSGRLTNVDMCCSVCSRCPTPLTSRPLISQRASGSRRQQTISARREGEGERVSSGCGGKIWRSEHGADGAFSIIFFFFSFS